MISLRRILGLRLSVWYATVFILKKPSCARSPCAKATPTVPRMNSSASMGAKTRVSPHVCRIVVPPFP